MKYTLWLLRIALAFALLYAGISSLMTPNNWIGWFPSFIFEIIPEAIILPLHGILNILLGIWVLSGWKAWIPGTIATIALVSIVVFNIPQMEIVFRDISLALVAIALSIIEYGKQKNERNLVEHTS